MIVVDMESSGLDPHKHALLSVGGVDFSNPKNTFYGECRIFERAHIDKEALMINGFTEEQIKDPNKKTDGELVAEFLAWAEKCPERTIAGQNVSIDRDFLRVAAERYHINWPMAYRVIDLHSVCYYHMARRGITLPERLGHSDLSLGKILVYCGLPEEPKPHNGLRGAIYETEAFSRLFYDKYLLDQFSQYKIPWA